MEFAKNGWRPQKPELFLMLFCMEHRPWMDASMKPYEILLNS
jgi:hypothetical protein